MVFYQHIFMCSLWRHLPKIKAPGFSIRKTYDSKPSPPNSRGSHVNRTNADRRPCHQVHIQLLTIKRVQQKDELSIYRQHTDGRIYRIATSFQQDNANYRALLHIGGHSSIPTLE